MLSASSTEPVPIEFAPVDMKDGADKIDSLGEMGPITLSSLFGEL